MIEDLDFRPWPGAAQPGLQPRAAAGARRSSYQLTFAVLTTGVASYALLQSLVIPLLSTIQAELHTSQDAATWVLTAYLLSASVATPILARAGDIYGKKRVLVGTLAALATGSVVAASSVNITMMITGRVIQGLAGGILPVGFGIIRDEFPAGKVAGAVGMLAAQVAVGSGLGIVLAGPVVHLLGWRWLFWLLTTVTVLAGIGAALFIPESRVRSPGAISWLPALLLTGTLVALLLPLSKASDWGWDATSTVGLFEAAAALAAAWVWAELRARVPLIDMRMMRQPAVWTNNAVSLMMGTGMYAMYAFLPEFVQTPSAAGYGFTASITRSGLMLLPMAATMFMAGLFAGRLTQVFGGKALVVAGSVVGAAALAALAFAHAQQWQVYLATAVMGIGCGLAYPAVSALIVSAVPPDQTGVASGMNANIRSIGGSIGTAIMASTVTSQLEASGLPKQAGYTAGFAMMGAALLLAAVAGLFIPAQRRAA